MATEFEATYLDINKDDLRNRLRSLGAIVVRSEYKQRRYNFDLQSLGKSFYEWARVRDEGGKITMAYKSIAPENISIHDQKEIEFEISDMDAGVEFLEKLGGRITNYSETFRERWSVEGVIVDIDTWPYLEPYVEIEATDEERVKEISEKLDFDYKNAVFVGAGEIYEMKYGIHPDKISKDVVVRLTFEDKNPFTN